ncbi:MAG: glycine/betaine ABC transporter substrate-binding protein [Clostridiales Family XIII bacterium]|jgi:osmoprotectant transport system substrate-binding protein|nr:glycine/betaine ABC transporter substrate-binding protein [Clostridiales Family XIII bacterium]
MKQPSITRKKTGRILILAFALALAFALGACGDKGTGSSTDSPAPDETAEGAEGADAAEGAATEGTDGAEQAAGGAVNIGSKNFTESLILGELYALALEDKGGLAIERKFNLADSAVHTALVSGEIDLYPEYTGTGLLSVLQLPLETDPQKVYDTVKKEYADQFDIVWLGYAPANDGQGIVVTKEASDKYGIKTITDLQKNAKEIRFLSQGEFDEREDGIPALEKTYGPLEWKSSTIIDNALKYTAMKNGEGDAAPAYTTEGYLVEPDFVLLEDDKHVWPPYNIAPVVRAATLEAHPDIADILDKVDALIDTPTITKLNAEVDIDGKEYAEVAKAFYDSIKDKL